MSALAVNPAVNPGVTDLLQMISNAASPALSSLLSSSKVQSALQNASPADLVQLSDQAMQLQMVDGLFGNPDTATQPDDSILAALYSPVADPLQTTVNVLG